MSKELAGHLLVRCLIEQGVETVFGVPGESFLAVLDGFYVHQGKIRFIACRHEGGAAFMAEAHGKISGRPGVCIVTRGPGATNAAIGVHAAFQASTPMVLLIGDVGGDFRDREAFQEIDFSAMFGPNSKGMAKRVERVDDPDRLAEYVQRAFATAMNGRPGPVVLVLPEDMLTKPTPASPLARIEPALPAISDADLHALTALLSKAERPLLIVGGLWSPAGASALENFSESWRMPVGTAFRSQDVFNNRHRFYAGDIGIGLNPKLAQRIKDSDLIIAFGARLDEMTTSGYSLLQAPRPYQKLVHVHVNADEINRVFGADLGINASNDSTAKALAGTPCQHPIRWEDWSQAANADYLSFTHVPVDASSAAAVTTTLTGTPIIQPIDMRLIIDVLRRNLPADAIITNGAGNFAGWISRYFRFHGLAAGFKTQLAPAAGAMGYGVPAGIAASLVTRQTVFTIAGDGDFLMNGQELATAAQYGGKSIILLLNNGMLGTIRMHQERHYPDRVSGTDLRNPDFCALARAYGYDAVEVTRTEEFEPTLRQSLIRQNGTLIEIKLSPQIISTSMTLDQIRAHRA